MIDVENVKKSIVDFLKENGPALPIKIAREIEMEPVFASAILGEMMANKKINTSNMKVGSSHIYLLRGQEEQLESFADKYLEGVVKEAYLRLKENKYLIDENQTPAVRVALRSLKDFAVSFEHEKKIVWRYQFVEEKEVRDLLEGKSPAAESPQLKEPSGEDSADNPSKNHDVEKFKKEDRQESPREDTQTDVVAGQDMNKDSFAPAPENLKTEQTPKSVKDSENIEEKQEKVTPPHTVQKNDFDPPFEDSSKEENKKEKSKYELTDNVKSYLAKRAFPLIKIFEETRSEFMGVARINSELGPTQYLVVAKTKKTVSDEDIRYCKSRAMDKNMPCYLLYRDKITKAGQNLLEELKNLVKTDKF